MAGTSEALRYEDIATGLVEEIGCDAASVQVVDEEPEGLRLVASQRLHPATAKAWSFLPAGATTVCGKALEAGAPFSLGDTEQDAAFAGTAVFHEWRRSRIRAVHSTPLLARERIVGMLTAYWFEPHTVANGELRLIHRLARNASQRLRAETDPVEDWQPLSSLREVNLRIHEMASTFDGLVAEDPPQEYLCECGCGAWVALTGSQFEVLIATDGTLMAEGHPLPRAQAARELSRALREDAAALRAEARQKLRKSDELAERTPPLSE